jgi:hypothetical protein
MLHHLLRCQYESCNFTEDLGGINRLLSRLRGGYFLFCVMLREKIPASTYIGLVQHLSPKASFVQETKFDSKKHWYCKPIQKKRFSRMRFFYAHVAANQIRLNFHQ